MWFLCRAFLLSALQNYGSHPFNQKDKWAAEFHRSQGGLWADGTNFRQQRSGWSSMEVWLWDLQVRTAGFTNTVGALLALCSCSAIEVNVSIQLICILLQLWMGCRSGLSHPSDSPKPEVWKERDGCHSLEEFTQPKVQGLLSQLIW